MAKEKQRHCTYCGEDIRVRLGLFYSDSYCCNCGSTIRTRQTLFGETDISNLSEIVYSRRHIFCVWK